MLRLRHLQRLLVREMSTRPSTSTSQDQEDTFGTLSRTGRKALAVHATERNYAEDPEGYDEEEFDLAPRKNAYYYKYEISKHARRGSVGLRKALELFQTMKAKDRLSPSLNNFSPLIYGCAKSGYTKRAFELYNEWLTYENRPTNSTITCLINACAECPFPEYGIERLNWFRTHLRVDMCRKLNIIQYNCLIKAYGKLGQLGEASKVIQEMISEGIYPDLKTFKMLLAGCAYNKEMGSALALRVYKRMRLYGIKPDIFVFDIFLRCIRDCGMGSPTLMRQTLEDLPAMTTIDEKLRLKSVVKKKTSNKNRFDNFEWVPLLSDLGHSIDTALTIPTEESASSKVKLIEGRLDPKNLISNSLSTPMDSLTSYQKNVAGLKLPNLLSDNHLELLYRIQAIDHDRLKSPDARLMLFGGMHGFLETMVKNDCKPTGKTFSILIGCVPPNPFARLEYFRLTKDYSIERDSLFYTLLIRYVCSSKSDPNRLQKGLKLVDQMHQDNIKPDITTFESLALGCDSKRTARTLIEDVEKCGFTVSHKMIRNLFKCAVQKRDFGLLNLLIKLSRERNFKPTKNIVDKLEELRLDGHDLVIKIEKNLIQDKDLPIWCDKHFVAIYDQFNQAFGYWLKGVVLEEEEHPWSQFKVETGSKRQGFVEFEKTFRALDQAKRTALRKGENLGVLIDQIKLNQKTRTENSTTH